jgi:hypothetical protein
MRRIIALLFILLLIQVNIQAQSCLPEGITFQSQAEIDNFQTNYPNCTEIEGDVFIGFSNSDITNLNGLSGLTSTGGGIYLRGNDSLTSLAGLINLIYIGGTLEIGDFVSGGNESLTSLTGLEGLTSIGGGLHILGNESLTSLTGLEGLTSIGGELLIAGNNALISISGIDNINASSINTLTISDNYSLYDCAIQSICDYLTSPNGVVDICNNADGCRNPPEIARACGITLTCLPYGNYIFSSQAEIDSFQIDYPGCTELQGDVWIIGDEITNIYGFNVLISIGGTLVIFENNALTSLSGLDQVNFIGGDLNIQGNKVLSSLTGLGSLACVGGRFIVSFNDVLTDLTGPNAIDSIGEGFEIAYNIALTSLSGLENLTCIHGYLYIYCNDALTSLSGLNNLTSIGGYLYIGESYGGNPVLVDLTALKSLTSIGGGLMINNNDALNNLMGLDSLTSVGGLLNISGNKVLKSISGIEKINSDLITDLIIENNDSLSTCEVQSICDYLTTPNGTIEIFDNATGCNSQQEVEAACGVGVDESSVVGRQSFVSIYPNPSSNVITVELLSNKPAKNTFLTIYNISGQALSSQLLLDKKTVVDVSALPKGVFLVKVSDDITVEVVKFLKQ